MTHHFGIIRFNSLGDVILLTPLVQNLRRDYPDARITIITRRPYDELFYADPDVDRVVALGGKYDRDGLPGLEAAITALGGERFDAIIDLQGDWRSRRLAWSVPARKRIGSPKQRLARWKLIHAKRWARPLIPKIDRYNNALARVPADVRSRMPRVCLSTAARAWARAESARTRSAEIVTTVGAHPGARWPTKRWPEEFFADCLSRLAERERARVFLFGSAPERDLLERTAAMMPDVRTEVYCHLPLQRVGALVEQCDVFLANDSGLMHLAAALSVPTVSLFGPTHPGLGFAPQGPRNRIFFGFAECSPCSLHGQKPCYQRKRFCLDRIEPAKVGEVMSELLSEGKVVSEATQEAT
jgi:heptosyltransferase-2